MYPLTQATVRPQALIALCCALAAASPGCGPASEGSIGGAAAKSDERQREAAHEPRIYGGVEIAITAAPWQAMLVYRGANDPYCGAVVLGARWVLTAQHCVADWETKFVGRIEVRAGIADWSAAGGQRRGVRAIVRYPGYSEAQLGKDVALLLLDRPLSIDNTTVRPISLIEDDAALVGQDATVSGWGMKQDLSFPEQLHAATVPITRITGDQLEAGDGIHDSCWGDSGGPVWIGAGSAARLVGIVSWGPCGEADDPGNNARIAAFRDWILARMQRTWIAECGISPYTPCGGEALSIGAGASCDEAKGDAHAFVSHCALDWCTCSTSNGRRDVTSCNASGNRCYLARYGAATDGNNPALHAYACAGAGDVAPGTLDGKCHRCDGASWSQTSCPPGLSGDPPASCGTNNFCFVTAVGRATDGNNGIIVPADCARVGDTRRNTENTKDYTCCAIGGPSLWIEGPSC